ncbi:DNA-binding domain-containing protein [Motiliproteus sp.]|uniref:HvfC/BufC N-terminal domain-containing protein n=1 Tax=Motiliproteus sp. TaxID=1898955 RepID=UPI003BAD1282
MNLTELQTDFQSILLDAECRNADWVAEPQQNLSSQQRLTIYHNAYRIRLIDTLYDTFEHTANYLGGEWFDKLAASYVQNFPSSHANLGQYGKDFSEHLAQQLPNDLEVAELAHMDWTLRRAFDGADATALTQQDLQQLVATGAEFSHFQPVPTLSLSTQQFNTLDIWHAINQEKAPPVAEQLTQPITILMWRKGHSPHFRSLSAIETTAINYLCQGLGLEAIGEALSQDYPKADIVTEFGNMIARWLDDELLTR